MQNPPPPFWLDRALPLLFAGLAMLEFTFRDDVPLPLLNLGLALTPALALYFRRAQLLDVHRDAGFEIVHEFLPGRGKVVFLVARRG